jgi:hypothetical protein
METSNLSSRCTCGDSPVESVFMNSDVWDLTFHDMHFHTAVTTFQDRFWYVMMRLCSWQISFCHSPATVRITLRSVKFLLSFSQADCFSDLWNETFLLSRNVLYAFEVILYLYYWYFIALGTKWASYSETGFQCALQSIPISIHITVNPNFNVHCSQSQFQRALQSIPISMRITVNPNFNAHYSQSKFQCTLQSIPISMHITVNPNFNAHYSQSQLITDITHYCI